MFVTIPSKILLVILLFVAVVTVVTIVSLVLLRAASQAGGLKAGLRDIIGGRQYRKKERSNSYEEYEI